MKTSLKITVSIFFFAILIGNVFAGPIVSGGGYGVLCNSNNSTSLRVLDLYEAENRYDLTIIPKVQTIKENYNSSILNIKRLFKNIDPLPFSQADSAFEWFFANSAFKEQITEVNDIGNTKQIPTSCQLVQIATFNDNQLKIEIHIHYWNMLSEQDKAALILHELMYRQFRELKYTTSERVRSNVACSFSSNCIPNYRDDATEFSFITLDEDSKSYHSQISFINNPNGVEIFLEQLQGQPFFAMTSAYFYGDKLALTVSDNSIKCNNENEEVYIAKINSKLIENDLFLTLKCHSENPAELLITSENADSEHSVFLMNTIFHD